jgi:hypothetical protein
VGVDVKEKEGSYGKQVQNSEGQRCLKNFGTSKGMGRQKDDAVWGSDSNVFWNYLTL